MKVSCHEMAAEWRVWTRLQEDRTTQVQSDMDVNINLDSLVNSQSTKQPPLSN